MAGTLFSLFFFLLFSGLYWIGLGRENIAFKVGGLAGCASFVGFFLLLTHAWSKK